jgi:hypothetical protein
MDEEKFNKKKEEETSGMEKSASPEKVWFRNSKKFDGFRLQK